VLTCNFHTRVRDCGVEASGNDDDDDDGDMDSGLLFGFTERIPGCVTARSSVSAIATIHPRLFLFLSWRGRSGFFLLESAQHIRDQRQIPEWIYPTRESRPY